MSPRNEPDHDVDGVAVDEEEEEDQQQQPQARKPKKPKLFNESGLSDEQRRQIRQDQRVIQQSLRDNEYSNFDEIEDVRDKNNIVFQTSVRYTREAVLDADNVDLIAAKYAKQIEKQVQAPRFDAVHLVKKLGQKCTNKTSTSQYFDWKFLGIEAGICFNAIPERVTFLAGALDHQVTIKVRAVRQARVKNTINDEVEVKPETVDNTTNKGDADKLSAMEKAMRVIRKKLKTRSLEEAEKGASTDKNGSDENNPDIDMVRFLFNPQSFTQTVENIFNFSFLIKKGEAEIGVRPTKSLGNSNSTTPSGGFVAYRNFEGSSLNDDPNDDMTSTATQAVCRFTMADWRRLCQQQAVAAGSGTTGSFEQGDLPHRTGTKHGRVSQ